MERRKISVDGDVYRCKCGMMHSKYIGAKFCERCYTFTEYRIEDSTLDEIIIRMQAEVIEIKKYLQNVHDIMQKENSNNTKTLGKRLLDKSVTIRSTRINNLYLLMEEYQGMRYNQYNIYRANIESHFAADAATCIEIVDAILRNCDIDKRNFRYIENIGSDLHVLLHDFVDISMKRFYIKYINELIDGIGENNREYNLYNILLYLGSSHRDRIITVDSLAKTCGISIEEATDIIKYMIITGDNMGIYLRIFPKKLLPNTKWATQCAENDKWIQDQSYELTSEFKQFLTWYFSTKDLFNIYENKKECANNVSL